MKGKLLTSAILATLLVGSNAMASIARQAVLGGQPVFTSAGTAAVVTNGVNGSLWYDDSYNVFYNPAYINEHKNYVTVNKGFEGGWFSSVMENFAYGVYVNRGQTAATGTPGATYGGGTFVAPGLKPQATMVGGSALNNTRRPIDLFFGGDTGIKWGAHLAWAYHRDQTGAIKGRDDGEITNRYWHMDLGAEVMGFEPFIGLTAFSKYQNNNAANFSNQDLYEFNIGTRYKYEAWTPYVAYRKYREAGSNGAFARQVQTRHSLYGLGVGHDTKVADGVHIMKNIGLWYDAVQDDSAIDAITLLGTERFRKYNHTILPINLALEAEATSWLTLRAGLTYDFINERKFDSSTNDASTSLADKKQSQNGTTTVRIGSTVKFGKLHIDSAFGNGTTATTSGETLDSSSMGVDSQTFALVSASYHW